MRGTYRFDSPPNILGGTMRRLGNDLGTLLVVWRGHFVVGVGSGHRPGAVTAAEIGDVGTEHQDRC